MDDIEKARIAVVVFLKKALGVNDLKIIKIAKYEGGWEAEAEVYEASTFIRSLGLPARLQDRNIYAVKMGDNLEIQSYELVKT